MLFGWILAFLSAAGNTGNDICKKMVMARGISPWEVMALLNAFGAALNLGYCLYTGYVPEKMSSFIIWACFLTMLGKNLAQFTYLLSLKNAPLSSVIPYLAWNPVFLLIVGFLWLGEEPRYLGVLGCLVVVVGAYLISLDAKNKMEIKKREEKLMETQLREERAKLVDGVNKRKDSGNGFLPDINADRGRRDSKGQKIEVGDTPYHEERKSDFQKKDNFIIAALKSMWAFKAGLYMMITGLAWTYTSALEKYILAGTNLPPPYFLGMQRAFMSIPVMIYCIYKNPKFLDHTFKSFFHLSVSAVVESTQILTYFWAMEYGVYVSYVIAIKRAGNIFLSVMVGRFIYKEKLTIYTIGSAGCMIIGVLLIVLG